MALWRGLMLLVGWFHFSLSFLSLLVVFVDLKMGWLSEFVSPPGSKGVAGVGFTIIPVTNSVAWGIMWDSKEYLILLAKRFCTWFTLVLNIHYWPPSKPKIRCVAGIRLWSSADPLTFMLTLTEVSLDYLNSTRDWSYARDSYFAVPGVLTLLLYLVATPVLQVLNTLVLRIANCYFPTHLFCLVHLPIVVLLCI